MARWLRSIASLLTVVTLAGTPALLSACVALCLPDAASSAHHAGPAVESAASACADHVAPAAPSGAANVTATVAPCCGDGPAAAAAFVVSSRTDTPPLAAVAGPASRRAWAFAPMPALDARGPSRAAPPPIPPRRTSVLRI